MSAAWALLRAADAPAPTIVVDGSDLTPDCTRAEAEALLLTVRGEILADLAGTSGLGVKNIVVLRPNDGLVRVEFFQGNADGPLMADSQQVCLNSLACALTAAGSWHAELAGTSPWTALMAGTPYVLRPDAA